MRAITEKIIRKKKKFTGKSFSVWDFTHDLGNNTQVTWEAVALADGTTESTMVLGMDRKNRVLLLEKYCAAHSRRELILPGGKRKKGEPLYKTAVRELKEETGWGAKKLKKLISLDILPGYLVGTTHGYIATHLFKTKRDGADEKEFLKPKFFSFQKVLMFIKNGKIRDARTVAFLLVAYKFIFSRE